MTDGTTGRLAFSLGLACAQLAIALYVCYRDPRRLVNVAFCTLGISLAAWTTAIGIAHTQLSSDLLVRLVFAAASLLALSLLTFVSIYPSSPFPLRLWYLAFLASGVLFTLLAFTGALVKESVYRVSGLHVTYGPLHPLFGVYIVSALVTTFVMLLTKLRSTTGRQRLQLRYLLYALLIPAGGIAVTNLFIPLVLKISYLGRYGPAFSLLFLGVTAHALIRQRLMDIKLVVGQTVSYGVAVLVTGTIFVTGLSFVVAQLYHLTEIPLGVQVALAFAAAVFFGPVTKRVREIFDRYCYREPYDYNGIIRRSTSLLSSTLDLQQLIKHLFVLFADSIRPEFVAAYLYELDQDEFRLVAYQGEAGHSEMPNTIQRASAVVQRLTGRDRLVLRDSETDGKYGEEAIEWLQNVDAEGAYAIAHEDRIVAILLLGRKLSGDPYFVHDVELLSTIASQAAVAIKNAELYRRVTLLEAQRRRAERVAESGALTAGIAHEIKNPLVAIRTFAELLPDRYGDEEFRSEFGRVMILEIARIDQLVDRLRGVARTAYGEHQVLDVRKPLEETLSLVSAQSEQAGILVRRSFDEEGTIIQGNHDQLKQLFLNLLINAFESMSGPGEVFVRLLNHRPLGVPTVTVEVEDQGPGIADDVRDTLFHPFVSTKHGSSGLGLWVCRRIADEHNAVLRVAVRESGKGGRFIIDFPAYRA